MDANAGYVIVGYLLTTLALCGYTLRLFARALAARRRAHAVAEHRRPA